MSIASLFPYVEIMKLFLPDSSPMLALCCGFLSCSQMKCMPCHSWLELTHPCLCQLSEITAGGCRTSAQHHELAPHTHTKSVLLHFTTKRRPGEHCYAINFLHSLNEITEQRRCKDLLSSTSCFLCLSPLTTCSARQGITRKITVKKDSAGTWCFMLRCWTLHSVCA